MKKLWQAAGVGMAVLGMAGQAVAACAVPVGPPGPITAVNTVATLNALLTGNTVCSPPTATQPNFLWQELHQAGGALVDYKRGPGHAVDPTQTVGSWVATGFGVNGIRATVTHTYLGAGGTYNYSVFNNGNGTHSFCGANGEFVTRIQAAAAC